MQLRIRLRQGPQLKQKRSPNRQAALALSALLTPAALMAFVLASWRIGADLRWTDPFAISDGIFSHWQVWIAVGITLQLCAVALNRYGRGDGASPP